MALCYWQCFEAVLYFVIGVCEGNDIFLRHGAGIVYAFAQPPCNDSLLLSAENSAAYHVAGKCLMLPWSNDACLKQNVYAMIAPDSKALALDAQVFFCQSFRRNDGVIVWQVE